MSASGSRGKGCCGLILSLGVSAVLMWLWIRNLNPKCSIETLYLPSLNIASNLTTTDPTLSLTLRLVNPNRAKGINYGPLNVTVYFPNRSNIIGSIVMPGFYQGYRKKASKLGQGAVNTTAALQAMSRNQTAVFRFDLATSVKFKTGILYGKRHRIRVGADVVINDRGVKVDQRGIRLRSMAPKMGSSCLVLGALVNILVFTLLNFW